MTSTASRLATVLLIACGLVPSCGGSKATGGDARDAVADTATDAGVRTDMPVSSSDGPTDGSASDAAVEARADAAPTADAGADTGPVADGRDDTVDASAPDRAADSAAGDAAAGDAGHDASADASRETGADAVGDSGRPDAASPPDASVASSAPVCMAAGTASEGWYTADGTLICLIGCAGLTPQCQRVGTATQGWYTTAGHGCPPSSTEVLHDSTCTP